MQEFRAAWCWEVHNILPFQLPSAHTLLNTHPAHVLRGPRKPMPCASLSTIGIPPLWSLSFSTMHWEPCQLCSGHSRNKCNTQKAPGALWKLEPTRMTMSSHEAAYQLSLRGKAKESAAGCLQERRAVPLLCRVAGWRSKDSLMESKQEGGKGGEGRSTQLSS